MKCLAVALHSENIVFIKSIETFRLKSRLFQDLQGVEFHTMDIDSKSKKNEGNAIRRLQKDT